MLPIRHCVWNTWRRLRRARRDANGHAPENLSVIQSFRYASKTGQPIQWKYAAFSAEEADHTTEQERPEEWSNPDAGPHHKGV